MCCIWSAVSYQRFTGEEKCTSHTIKEKTVTDAVAEKIREICRMYLNPDKLEPDALAAAKEAAKGDSPEEVIRELHMKIDSLTAKLDRMYMDRLSGLLSETDFERIHQKLKADRAVLQKQLRNMESENKSPGRQEERAKELVSDFLQSAPTSRELLVSLIERVEMTENREIIIRFRFREPDAVV